MTWIAKNRTHRHATYQHIGGIYYDLDRTSEKNSIVCDATMSQLSAKTSNVA